MALKSLPRLPSTDDYDDEGEVESSHSSQATPKVAPSTLPSSSSIAQPSETEAGSAEGTPRIPAKTLPPPPDDEPDNKTPTPDDTAPPIPEKPVHPPPSRRPTEGGDSKLSAKSDASASTRTLPKIPHGEELLQLLQNLREDFQREEQSLYSTLAKTPNECLNNVRNAFKTSAKGATKRMTAWEGKHCSKGTKVTSPYPEDPIWWTTGNHAIPGSNILINESDWGSMIAFTLRYVEFVSYSLPRCLWALVVLEIIWLSSPVCRRAGVCQWISRQHHRRRLVALRCFRDLHIDYLDPHASNQTPTMDTRYGKNRKPTQPLSAGRSILGTHHLFFR